MLVAEPAVLTKLRNEVGGGEDDGNQCHRDEKSAHVEGHIQTLIVAVRFRVSVSMDGPWSLNDLGGVVTIGGWCLEILN